MTFFVATGLAYVDAGQGNDTLTGGQGHNILCGAEGDDLITAGPRSNVIYPGQGSNILNELKQTDTVFTESEPTHLSEGQVITAKEAENTSGRPGPKSFKVSAKPLSESGFIIQGSDEFIERVKNDLTQLLGSGVGHQLPALTQSIRQSHKPITIAELKHIDSGLYIPNLAMAGPTSRSTRQACRTSAARFTTTRHSPGTALYPWSSITNFATLTISSPEPNSRV
jgi:Ca2+-binding RTX toxin-like protein